MIDRLFDTFRDRLRARIWLISDLQQTMPARAHHCLKTAIDDFQSLDRPIEQVWYLGDAVEGGRVDLVEQMAQMQIDLLGALGVPIRYIMGNHDFDCQRRHPSSEPPQRIMPFYERIAESPQWRTVDPIWNFYFTEIIAGHYVIFLSDHAAADGHWFTSHGRVHGDDSDYPHDARAYRELGRTADETGLPILTVGHYAFPGGSRTNPDALQNHLLPLSARHHMHFYGHSHLGDAVYGKQQCHRKIAYIDDQRIPQINVSSLENHRGDQVRSVVLELYDDDTLGIFFRNHEQRLWADAFIIDPRGLQPVR